MVVNDGARKTRVYKHRKHAHNIQSISMYY